METLIEASRLPAVRARSDIVFQTLVDPLLRPGALADPAAAGRRLWRSARAGVRDGSADDRSLYWARLAIGAQLETRAGVDRAAFEWSSRGMDDVVFDQPAAYRVLITGFDPFGLDEQIAQSNPSGLAVLALDGQLIETGRGPALVQGAVVPVRFADFDAGLVESFLEPHLDSGELALVLTISMGREAFDLERFPGRRRSAAVPDNVRRLTGANPTQPLIPRLAGTALDGPEFLEFSLPAEAMLSIDTPFAVRDNRTVQTLERGELVAGSLTELDGSTAVRGSGGGYLSNEISYRALLSNRRTGADVPMGHLHTPRVAGYDEAVERQMVEQIRALIVAAIGGLAAR